MDNHPIESLMRTTMESIRDMVDVNTIVGDAVQAQDGSVIIPISRVSFGFASGGSEFGCNKGHESALKYPFGGGAGAGVSVKPVAFLVIKNDIVRLLSIEHDNTYDKIIDSIPQIMDTIKGMIKPRENKNNNQNDITSNCKCNTPTEPIQKETGVE